MNYKRLTAAVMVAAMGMTTTACNESQGFNASGAAEASSNGAESVALPGEDIDTKALDADLDGMEKSVADMQSEIAKIDIIGLASGVNSGVQSKSVVDNAAAGIRKLFDGVITGVHKVKEQAAALRAKVNVNLAKLDPLNPLHVALVMKMQDILKYLDQLDDQISAAIGKAADFVDAKLLNIDKTVANIKNDILKAFASIYWANLRAVMVECNAKLRAEM